MTAPAPITPQLDRVTGRSIFGLDAAGYHAGRLGYPDALYEKVLQRAKPKPCVLEIGAGTGLVTEALLSRNVDSVTAVEPSSSLVEFVRQRLPDSRLIMVTAPFPEGDIEGKFDLAVCAAAFHWMNPEQALSRVKSLLRPGGVWAVWWHSYRNFGVGDPLADAVTPMLEGIPLPPSDGLTQHYSLDVKRQSETLADAGFRNVEHFIFRNERTLTTAQVRVLYESYSYVRALPTTQRTDLLDKIAALVESEFGGRAPNLVLTPLYIADVSDGPSSLT
jgi:SAM-dependent methyltransferase